MNKRTTIGLLAASGAAVMALLASPAHADARVHLHIGIPGYVQPAPVYTQPSYVYTQPAYVYTQPGYVHYDRPYHHGHYRRGRDSDRDGIPNRFDRDRDNDGRPNWRDRDRDGDGVPNHRDRRPDNARRY